MGERLRLRAKRALARTPGGCAVGRDGPFLRPVRRRSRRPFEQGAPHAAQACPLSPSRLDPGAKPFAIIRVPS
jgi:hypothetical protein